jgi:preprotein translocase subunit YajC
MSSEILTILGAAAAGAEQPPFWVTIMPFVAMGFIFWFLILRPQMRQLKEQRTKIAAIKKGDQVLTAGGLVGKVIKVDDHYAEIELAPNVKVKAVKSTISDIIDPLANPAAND